MIPKIIHYVWLGGAPHTPMLQKCIQSWKTHLPDYKIIEWNENNIDITSNGYLQDALKNKKWAFASDVIRLQVVHEYGGFYFDTDLEVTQSFNDFLDLDLVLGFEKYNDNYSIQTASFGAKPNCHVIKHILQHYDKPFYDKNGEFDLTPNPSIFIKSLRTLYPNSFIQPLSFSTEIELEKGIKIFPHSHFCLVEPNKINYSIHHFSGSWKDNISRKCKCKIGNIKLIRIRSNLSNLPKTVAIKYIQPTEKVIFCLKINKNLWWILLKTNK